MDQFNYIIVRITCFGWGLAREVKLKTNEEKRSETDSAVVVIVIVWRIKIRSKEKEIVEIFKWRALEGGGDGCL